MKAKVLECRDQQDIKIKIEIKTNQLQVMIMKAIIKRIKAVVIFNNIKYKEHNKTINKILLATMNA
jgi:hypothetical protein